MVSACPATHAGKDYLKYILSNSSCQPLRLIPFTLNCAIFLALVTLKVGVFLTLKVAGFLGLDALTLVILGAFAILIVIFLGFFGTGDFLIS